MTITAATPLGTEPPPQEDVRSEAAPYDPQQQRLMDMCQLLLSSAAAFGLEECWQWKPILDGKQVMSLLKMTKAGPEMGLATAAVMEWQLAHPGGTVEECRPFIETKFSKS